MKFNPKYRPTHLLLLIFVGLLFYYTISISMTAENKKRSDSILLKFSLADVTGFSILNDRVKQLFTRNRNDWQAQGLPHLKLSKPDIDSFLDDVKNIECIRTIKNTSDLLPFGLEQTNLMISIMTPNRTMTVLLGGKSASSKQIYALTDGKVRLIPAKFESLFHKDMFTFRSKKFFDINTDHVSRIDIGYLGRRAILEKKGQHWEISYPFHQLLIDEIVNTFLFEIEDLKVKEFIEGGTIDMAYYNLPSHDQIVLSSDSGFNNKITFGKRTKDGTFALHNDNPSILYLVDPYLPESGLTNFLSVILTKKNLTPVTGKSPSTVEQRSNK